MDDNNSQSQGARLTTLADDLDARVEILQRELRVFQQRITEKIETAQRAANAARAAVRIAPICERRARIMELRAAGATFREIGEEMNITADRAHQLVRSEKRKAAGLKSKAAPKPYNIPKPTWDF